MTSSVTTPSNSNELLVNGSFEDGTHNANTVNGLTGWCTVSGSPDSPDDGGGSEYWNPSLEASDGTGYVTMWSYKSCPQEQISQTLAAPLEEGTEYSFTFKAYSTDYINCQWFTPSDIPVTFEILDQDGNVLGSVIVQGTDFEQYEINFTAPAGVTGIQLRPNGSEDPSATYPAVTLDEVSLVAATPEPTGDGYVDGTAGDDVIDTSYEGDPHGDKIDNNDAILPGEAPNDDIVRAGAGDDTVKSGLGDDDVYAGSGDDTVDGGEGNDTIYGDGNLGGTTTVREKFEWDEASGYCDEGDASGFTQNTGTVDVTFSIVSTSATPEVEWEDASGNVAGIDTGALGAVDPNSGLSLESECNNEGAKVALGFSEEVSNVAFNINDVDHDSEIWVKAYDAAGNEVSIQLVGGSKVAVSGNHAASEGGSGVPSGSDYSVQVTIPGPVARVEITHNQDGIESSHVQVSDVYFDASVGVVDDGGIGNDTLMGGAGNDTIYGDTGDGTGGGSASGAPLTKGHDVISGGEGDDTIYGEVGNDTISGDGGTNYLDGGSGDDTFIGGAGADTFKGGADQDNIDYSGSGAAVNVNLDTGVLSGGDADNDTIKGGIDGIIGSEYDDVLVGFDQQGTAPGDIYTNQFWGNGGNDTISGKGGADFIDGGTGDDVISGGGGADVLKGGDDRDTFTGLNAGDTVDGGAGGNDWDVLDLTGSAPSGGSLKVTITGADSNGNGSDGYVTYYDSNGDVTGTLQFEEIEEIVPCFTPGTLIATPKGERRVEELQEGDRVITRDNGIQEIRWVGHKPMDWRQLEANKHLKPVLIQAGSLGHGLPERDMLVSPNHRVLVSNDRTALYFEEREVLVSAKHLVDNKGVHRVDTMGTTYIHFMFDHHEVVLSDGAWTESFQPGDYSLKGIGNAQRTEIFELFPELETSRGIENYTVARRTLKAHEAKMLLK